MKINKAVIGEDIRHISFDMWNTLISPNLKYTEIRTEVLQCMSGISDTAAVKDWYTSVKRELDSDAECEHKRVTTPQAFERLIAACPVPMSSLHSAVTMQAALEMLFKLHPPIVLPETIEMLKTLRSEGYTLSIASNTNFISGATLSQMVAEWGVDWKFQMYSDLLSVGKPHPAFFSMLKLQAATIIDRDDLGCHSDQILHIGDHPVCDGDACHYGMYSRIIKNPQDLIQTLTH